MNVTGRGGSERVRVIPTRASLVLTPDSFPMSAYGITPGTAANCAISAFGPRAAIRPLFV